ncbi:unnamed protein product [Lampetra planeri]
MEQAVLNSLVLERMLSLAQEFNVFLPATEEDDLSSLKGMLCGQGEILHDGIIFHPTNLHSSESTGESRCITQPAITVTSCILFVCQRQMYHTLLWHQWMSYHLIALGLTEWRRLQAEDALLLKLRSRIKKVKGGKGRQGMSLVVL